MNLLKSRQVDGEIRSDRIAPQAPNQIALDKVHLKKRCSKDSSSVWHKGHLESPKPSLYTRFCLVGRIPEAIL